MATFVGQTYTSRKRKPAYVDLTRPLNMRPMKQRAMVVARVGSARGPRFGRSNLQTETKYFDTSFSQTLASAADWTGTEVPCTNYVQSDGTTVGAYTDSALIPSAVGPGYGQVVGSKYNLKKVRVRGALIPSPAVDQADVSYPLTARVVLVLDTQPNGAQAQGEEVFTDMGTATQCVFSFLAMGAGGNGRFRILKDETIILNPAVAGTDGTNTNSVCNEGTLFSMEYAPKKPLSVRIKASASTPAVSVLSDSNIFLLAKVSNASPAVTITGCARAYYVD